MIRPSILTAGSLLALAAAVPAQAQAQEAEDIGTITVTAQLREQDVLDVPIAITAYEGEFLERLGLRDFEEISRFVPGLEVQNQSPNNPGFVIRGITSDTGSAFGEPRVSVYQDGVSISKSRGSYVEPFDLERIEVARGPQSTLYGRGALIGAVNLVQNKADTAGFDAAGRFAYGNLDSILAEAMVNAPLSDNTAIRIAGRYRTRDGYVDNLAGGPGLNSVDTGAVRASLRAETPGGVTLDVIGNYQEDHPSGTSFKSLAYLPTDAATGAVLGTTDADDGAALAAGTGFVDGTDLGLDRKVWGLTAIINAPLGDALRLTSITAYRDFDNLEVFDADGTSLPILTAAEQAVGEQFSQELRLVYEGERVSGFVGAAYFHEEGYQRTPAQFDERMVLARLAGLLQGPVPGAAANQPAAAAFFDNTAFTGALLQGVAAASGVALAPAQAQAIAANLKPAHQESSTNYSRTDAFDVFADLTFHISDAFEIGGGLRYTRDDKRSGITGAVLNGRSILGGFIGALGQPAATRTALLGALAVPGAANIPTSQLYPVPLFGLGLQPTAGNGDALYQDLDTDGFTWRANARYELSPVASLYANYARGRRPEVLSAATPAAPGGAARFDAVEEETVDSFEIGARTEVGRTLYLDASVYYYMYDNFQTTVQDGTLFITTNAGEATSYGAELQARWSPTDALQLFGTYAYNHSRFDTGIREDNRFRLSPDHTFSLGATFGVPVGEGRIELTPTLSYQSQVFFDDDNDRPELQQPPQALVADNMQDELQDGYALVNARLGYVWRDQFRIEGFVNNLLDESYIKDAGNTGDGLGLATFIAGEPRIYGVQISSSF